MGHQRILVVGNGDALIGGEFGVVDTRGLVQFATRSVMLFAGRWMLATRRFPGMAGWFFVVHARYLQWSTPGADHMFSGTRGSASTQAWSRGCFLASTWNWREHPLNVVPRFSSKTDQRGDKFRHQ
jgi:hypothetical protein